MNIIIRPAKKHDKYFIAKAMVAASDGLCDYLHASSPLPPENIMAFEIAKDKVLLSYQHCHIAEKEGLPVGVVCAYTVPDNFQFLGSMRILQPFYEALPAAALYIDTLYVIPDYRGQGIGKYLLTHVASASSCLYVWEDNYAVIKLYKQCGFTLLKTMTIDDPDCPCKKARLLMAKTTDLLTNQRSISCPH